MDDFKALKVWQVAIAIAGECRQIFTPARCRSLPDFRRDTLRAAGSIANNIAEACGRTSLGDQLHFLSMSRGSLYEVENALETALRERIIGTRVHHRLVNRIALARRMLDKLRNSLVRANEVPRKPSCSNAKKPRRDKRV
jgi:four helix bundle protein